MVSSTPKDSLNIEDILKANNVVDLLDDTALTKVSQQVLGDYEKDKTSCKPILDKMKDLIDLAKMVSQQKTYPWDGAANVKFPLITIASTQFAARAYPALVKAPDLVKYRVQGSDGDGEKRNRSDRISRHMSWQFLEEDEPWEEGHDKLMICLPIVGSCFKKSYYDKTKGHNCSTLVLPKNLVVHYYAKSIEDCERKTEVMELSPREIKERQLRGIFTDVDLANTPTPQQKPEDKRQGVTPPPADKDSARTILEQHCYLDLDKDGYAEPYVVTVDESTATVLRIVSRWKKVTTEQSVRIEELQKRIKAFVEGMNPNEGDVTQALKDEQEIIRMNDEVEMLSQQKPKVLKIDPVEFYTQYTFLPSPDGGFYGIGFGALMGPMNDSVNTLINQLIDAGHMSSGALGFIGKGLRIKGGNVRFQPYEFKELKATGGQIRDNIVQLNIAEPSPVLFQLLSLLISYAERIGSVTDTMVGENPGQNTPAYNMSAMLEQGMQLFNGIFKRVYRSQRAEFRKHFALNAIYLDKETYFSYQDSESKVLATDYTADSKDLIPAADPNAFSSKEKTQKAMMITERAAVVPGYDPIVVEKKWLSAMDMPDSAELYPLQPSVDEEGNETGGMELVYPPQPDPEFEIQREDLARKTLEGQSRHDLQKQEVEIKYMLAEAEIAKLISEAKEREDKTLIEHLKIQMDDLISKRQALTAVSVAQIGAKNAEKAD